jgi:hypothetical protein
MKIWNSEGEGTTIYLGGKKLLIKRALPFF